MKRRLIWSLLSASLACAGVTMTDAQRASVRDEVEATLKAAYDLSKPDVERRMLSLYAPSGRVVSASAGRVVTSRDTLTAGIKYFWEYVGVNMIGPKWEWDSLYVDVLSPTSAVVTGSYRIPHHTPRHQPHVIAGAITAVFAKRDGKWVIVQEHLSDLPTAPDSTQRAPGHDHP